MGNNQIIWIAIIACFILLLWVLWSKQILGMIVQAVVGACLMGIANLFIPVGLQVGINIITLGCAAVFGIPGVVMAYLINYLT